MTSGDNFNDFPEPKSTDQTESLGAWWSDNGGGTPYTQVLARSD